MLNIPNYLMLPLLCMVVIILSMVVALVFLRRNTRVIQDKVKDFKSAQAENEDSERWSRADLMDESSPGAIKMVLEPCPACGSENPVGSVACQFCGKEL